MTIDKGHSLASECVCQIRGLDDRSVVPQHGSVKVWRLAQQETEELIKPALIGTKVLRST